jgi:hypothetical protein
LYLKMGCDCFLPNPFKFIIYFNSSNHLTLYCQSYWQCR